MDNRLSNIELKM